MTAKTNILAPTTFASFGEFFRFLRSTPISKTISRGQAETLADVVDANLPAEIKLDQRTPKGTTYIYINGDFAGTVNSAAKYERPLETGYKGKFLTRKF